MRRPRAKKDLRTFSGRISEVTCPAYFVVLGTDCAIGKRTTATILTGALNAAGIKAVMVGTGQTGLIQGAKHGVALDAIPSQFCAGEMEAAVVEAFEAERPDVIIVEGQGALSHPAYLTSGFILRGSQPHAVIVQHAPGRRVRADFPDMPMPTPASEIKLIETFSDTKVIGLTINHEHMTDAEVVAAIILYEIELHLPVTDALTHSPAVLVDMVTRAFPELDPWPWLSRPCSRVHLFARVGSYRALMRLLRELCSSSASPSASRKRRHVHPEASAEALLEPVPTADRVVFGPPPRSLRCPGPPASARRPRLRLPTHPAP